MAVLAGRGLYPLAVEPMGRDAARALGVRGALGGRRAVPASDLATGLRTLATLLEAGMPVGRALWAFADVAPPAWSPAVPMLRQAIREGRSLGAALAGAPIALPPVVLGIIRAGDAGGGLARAVARAADLAERDADMRASLRAALAYPVLLATVGTGAVALLVTVVIPRFAAVLMGLGQVLPPTTRLVLAAAAGAKLLVLPGLFTAALGLLAWRMWTSHDEGRSRWHAFLLALPLVGDVRLAAGGARVCIATAELLTNGMPLSGALVHAAGAAGDVAMQQRVLAARERVLRGERLGQALTAERAMPPTALKLIQTGEESGQLVAMLTNAARVEMGRAETILRTGLRLLEPALLLLFGGLVTLVAAALLQAVYSVRPGV